VGDKYEVGRWKIRMAKAGGYPLFLRAMTGSEIASDVKEESTPGCLWLYANYKYLSQSLVK
jgi:hypothetical protein